LETALQTLHAHRKELRRRFGVQRMTVFAAHSVTAVISLGIKDSFRENVLTKTIAV